MEIIYCKHSESVWQAAERCGFAPPRYRVGLTHDARPREDEEKVTEVRAGRYALGVPIFERSVEMPNSELGIQGKKGNVAVIKELPTEEDLAMLLLDYDPRPIVLDDDYYLAMAGIVLGEEEEDDTK